MTNYAQYDEEFFYEPMRTLRIDKCHMPWYEIKSPQEEDERFTIGALLIYILLVYGADGYGYFDGSFKDLYRHYPGGCPVSKEATSELVNRLQFLCSRPQKFGDAFLIRPTEKTPAFDAITPAKPLHLRVIKLGNSSARNYFYVRGDMLRTLMSECDRRCAAPMFATYMYLISNMFTVKYLNEDGNEITGYFNSAATHKKLCNALDIEEKTMTRYLMRLREIDLIGYVPGEFGRDSVFTDGNIPELVSAAIKKQEQYYLNRYCGIKAKYRSTYHGRKGPC